MSSNLTRMKIRSGYALQNGRNGSETGLRVYRAVSSIQPMAPLESAALTILSNNQYKRQFKQWGFKSTGWRHLYKAKLRWDWIRLMKANLNAL